MKLIAVWAKTQNLGIKQTMILEDTAKAKLLTEMARNVVVSDPRGHADTQTVLAAVEATAACGDDRLLMATLQSLPKRNGHALDAIKEALLWEQLKCQQTLEQLKKNESKEVTENFLNRPEHSESIKVWHEDHNCEFECIRDRGVPILRLYIA